MGMLPPDITGLPEWAQSRLRRLEQREDNLRAENTALRGEVATLRGARSAEDVREMLYEASCVDVTDARCARIWSLLEHPATTMTTLAVIADERGESYAKARAELAALQSRLAAAEAELAQMTGERDRYKREVTDYEEREASCCAEDVGFEEVIAALRKRAEAAEAEVVRLKEELRAARCAHDSLKDTLAKEPPEPYTPRVGDVAGQDVDPKPGQVWSYSKHETSPVVVLVCHDVGEWWIGCIPAWGNATARVMPSTRRYLRPATAEERAAAGLPVEPCAKCGQVLPDPPGIGGEYPCKLCGVPTLHDSHAKPEVLPEHLAWIEAQAAHYAEGYNHPVNGIEPRMVAARALVAAVARRDGGAK